MKTITFILTITLGLYANMAVARPAVMGDPVLLNNVEIGVTKEVLNLEFYETRRKIICKFTAIYHLDNNCKDTTDLVGTFYSIYGENITIKANNSIRETVLERSVQKRLDSLSIPEKKRGIFPHRRKVIRNSFYYTYLPDKSNVITVSGKMSTQFTSELSMYSVSLRHPFLNNESEYGVCMYLLKPIESWKSVGQIEVNITYPKRMNLKSNLFGDQIYNPFVYNSHTKKDTVSKQDSSVIHSEGYTFKVISKSNDRKRIKRTIRLQGEFPPALYFSSERGFTKISRGGAKIGFGKQYHSKNFIMQYGWESSIAIRAADLYLALDFETDYRKYNTIALTTKIMAPGYFFIPNVGGGTGIVYNVNSQKGALRLFYDSNFTIIGLTGIHDYYPSEKRWNFSLLGAITF